MGKLRRPELPPGALDELVRELHALHVRAGRPSTREMARGQTFSYTTVHDLFTRTITEPPRLPVLHAVVERLASIAPRSNVDEILDKFDELWRAANDDHGPRPSPEPTAAAESKEEIREPRHEAGEPVAAAPGGRAMTKELFFLAGSAAPLHDTAAELRRAGFLVRDQPHDIDGTWSLMAYSAASELSDKDLATLDLIAERCGVDFDGWGTYVGPPHLDNGPGKPPVAALFELGDIVETRAALDRMHTLGVGRGELLRRHAAGDWGDVSPSDARANNRSLHSGDEQLLSAYGTGDDRLLVITEWDRSSTTVLRPGDL